MRRWSARQAALGWSGLAVATLLVGGALASSQATAAAGVVVPALKSDMPASPAAWIWPEKSPEPCWSAGDPFRNRCSPSASQPPPAP